MSPLIRRAAHTVAPLSFIATTRASYGAKVEPHGVVMGRIKAAP